MYCPVSVLCGSLFFQVLNFQPDAILANANISKGDLKELVDTFGPVGESFTDMFVSLKNITARISLDSIVEAQTGKPEMLTFNINLCSFYCLICSNIDI